jgi:EmrB/QacA subfamily drug resistance transporter
METQTVRETTAMERAQTERSRLALILPGLLLGMLLAALDQTIVGTAMPRVIAELQGLEHYAWVFTAYMLTSTVTVPLYGKLSDLYGRRTFFLFGMIVFLIGSALSGMAQSMTQLIFFRALQGIGGGALFPIAIAIVGDLFPPAERGKWQGLFAAVFGFSAIIGPSLGGWITDNWGWRWVFYVNMPVGALALLTTGLTMPKLASGRQHRIDYLGAALLVSGVTPLLLAFSWAGTEYPWSSPPIIGLFGASALFLVLFVAAELRAPEPILDLRLFGNRIFTPTLLAAFLIAIGMFGTILYLPLFVQAVLGRTATNSGAVLTPMMLGFVFSSIVGGQILSRTGRYKILAIGTVAVAVIGMFLLSRMDVTTTSTTVVRNMIILGLGIGTTMSLFTIIVQNAFPAQRLGEVTSALTFFRSIGGTVGAAILGTVMTKPIPARAHDPHSRCDPREYPCPTTRRDQESAGLHEPRSDAADAAASCRVRPTWPGNAPTPAHCCSPIPGQRDRYRVFRGNADLDRRVPPYLLHPGNTSPPPLAGRSTVGSLMSRKSRSGQSLCNDDWPERPQRAKEERAVAWLSPPRAPRALERRSISAMIRAGASEARVPCLTSSCFSGRLCPRKGVDGTDAVAEPVRPRSRPPALLPRSPLPDDDRGLFLLASYLRL